jgi:hypothetical protein
MRYVYFLLSVSFSFFVLSISHAMQYAQTWGWISPQCIEAGIINHKSYSFWNIYYQDIADEFIQNGKQWFFFGKCGFRSAYGVDWSTVNSTLMPLYHPRRWPIAFYRVYFWSTQVWTPFFQSSTFNLQWRWFPMNGFHIWTMFHWNRSDDVNKQAYLKSLEPPFSTAHIVQWYVYLWNPMIVARNREGLVTDVFIQNFRWTKDQKEIARKYLGDKWYRP